MDGITLPNLHFEINEGSGVTSGLWLTYTPLLFLLRMLTPFHCVATNGQSDFALEIGKQRREKDRHI